MEYAYTLIVNDIPQLVDKDNSYPSFETAFENGLVMGLNIKKIK